MLLYMKYKDHYFYKQYKKTSNLSFLENLLMDNENGYDGLKINVNRDFIKDCLKINGRSIDILYNNDASLLLDKELLKIAYTSTGPALIRSLTTCYRKTIRKLLQTNMKYTMKKHGNMIPKRIK
jgi:hypothetical protein